jgi:integrase/recombinase XerD
MYGVISMTGRPKHTSGKAQVLTEKQQRQVIQFHSGGGSTVLSQRNITILIFSFKLGLRAKELASLNIGDVVDDKGNVRDVLRLTTDKTKGERHRDLPLTNATVRKQIKEYVGLLGRSPDSPLFQTIRRKRFSPNSLQQHIKKMFHDAGLDGKFTSHSGRRTFITTLARKGYDVNSIRELAGHSSLATTQTYIDNDPEALGRMLKSL